VARVELEAFGLLGLLDDGADAAAAAGEDLAASEGVAAREIVVDGQDMQVTR
jgi:hypothetical protein